MQLQPRVGEPLGELRDGTFVVVVEMPAGREDLHRIEPVRGDVNEMLSAETMLVEEMGRDAKPPLRHELIV